MPGGREGVIYKRRTISPPRCAMCNTILSGFPKRTHGRIRTASKTKKTVSRMYGGNLCPRCLRQLIKAAVRSAS